MRIAIQTTYHTVTPESAEHGDYEDHGFMGVRRFSIADETFERLAAEIGRDAALRAMTPDPEVWESDNDPVCCVDDAIEFLRSYGPFEPSDSVLTADTRLTTLGEDSCYERGERLYLSFHIKSDDPQAVLDVLAGALS